MNKLWIIGCSITHGVGVTDNQSWSKIIANQLNLPTEFITAEGSSIEWAADQILRSDINSGDIVLWGITSPNRFMYYQSSGKVNHILNTYYQNNPNFHKIINKHQLVDDNIAYKAINYIHQVQNFLTKIKCKYAFLYMLPGIDKHRLLLSSNILTNNTQIAFNQKIQLSREISDYFTRKIPPTDIFVDVGDDGIHPGPEQHKLYAEQFLKILNRDNPTIS